MRVVRVEIPPDNSYGLKPILMDRLSSTVVLAGKNGAGKSRLLNRLNGWTSETVWPASNRAVLKQNLAHLSRFTREALATSSHFDGPDQKQHWEKTLAGHYDLEFDKAGTPTFASFVPKHIQLVNPETLNKHDFLRRAKEAEAIGAEHLHGSSLARIQQLQDRWWNSTHQSSTIAKTERDEAIKRYEQLNRLVERFIGERLKRDLDDRATLYGYPIGGGPFSDGQKILLQFCVAIHAQADKLSELIVLMDEPENHLHPGAMLDAIEQIQPALSNGQLWIATHSIPLLAHFDPENIWWMEDGGVQHAGSTPEKVLESLIGGDERIAKLNDFLGLPAALAASHFARQCLLPPAVLDTGGNDPQTLQIARLLTCHRAEERLRILDFGAGRGRLISALREGTQSLDALTARIDYRAFDVDSSYHSECEAAIARVYGDSKERLFHQESDLRATLDPASVDVVVMCNVLHEIDVTEWLEFFSDAALLQTALKPDGFLLVVEDTEMRVGERAHQRGFLVLDTAGLKTLFGIPESEVHFKRDDARGDGRLQAHLIPKRYLANTNSDRLRSALQHVRQMAMGEIKRLRSGEANYRQGRRHAFHVQQLANAQLGLASIGG